MNGSTESPDLEGLPNEVLMFLRLADPGKDPQRFIESLTSHYREQDGSWRADWSGFCFPARMDFAGATFVRPLDLTGATFLGPVSFKGATFAFRGHFDRATFLDVADFSGALFNEGASFSHAVFQGPAHFKASTFSGGAAFGETQFHHDARFGGVSFDAECGFGAATFVGNASFGRAKFAATARFQNARFQGNANFGSSVFAAEAVFRAVRFLGPDTKFPDASLSGTSDFYKALFTGRVQFENAEILEGLFHNVVIRDELRLLVSVLQGGTLQFRGAVNDERAGAGEAGSGPVIRFGPMSLERVELRSMDLSSVRLAAAGDIEKLSLYDVRWTQARQGNRLADEDDMELELKNGTGRGPTAQEVERLYRSLRKNREDRNDRGEGHRWYFAEMEVGRKQSTSRFTRAARNFYRFSSGYGLSARLATLSLLVVVATAFFLFSIPWVQICPVHDPASKLGWICVGWGARLRLVLLSVSLQGVPDGVRLVGLLANAVWLLARVAGAAMLLSIGVAFRNQISR